MSLEIKEKLPRLGHIQRKHYLEEHYGLYTNKAISMACGVHESTIDTDIREWKNSGDYDEWLDRRWHNYLEADTIDDKTKFLALTKLKERRMTQLSTREVKGEVKVTHDITSLLDEYDSIFENVAQSYLQKNNPRE